MSPFVEGVIIGAFGVLTLAAGCVGLALYLTGFFDDEDDGGGDDLADLEEPHER